jgi:hypothetical protein
MSMGLRMVLAVFLAVILAPIVFAQHCPRSKRTIYFLVENGTSAKDLRYELFPVLPLHTADKFETSIGWAQQKARVTPEQASDLLNGGRARPVFYQDAEDMLRNYDPAKYKPATPIVKNGMKGGVAEGKLVLNATEYSRNLFLMRVNTSNFDPVYYLADFVGGCNGVDRIIIMKDRSWPME